MRWAVVGPLPSGRGEDARSSCDRRELEKLRRDLA